MLHFFVLVAILPWEGLFRSRRDSSTGRLLPLLPGLQRLVAKSQHASLIKALWADDKLLFLVVIPGFYCLLISCTNIWYFIYLSLLTFPQRHEYFP